METKELQVVNFEEYAMTPEKVQAQVNVIQKVMAQTMKSGEHYGTIPGCGKKPALLKPGAEKISMTFRLAPSYNIKRTDLADLHREYEIICTLTHTPSGQIVAQGVGLCTSMESKYRYRKAELVCPSCGKTAIIKGKKEYGGGWVCWGKKGGCGSNFSDNDETVSKQPQGKIENEDIADCFNTVLKMAKKRAHVDSVLTATAASDIFIQDVQDLEENETTSEQIDSKIKEEKDTKQQKTAEDERTKRAKVYIDSVVSKLQKDGTLDSCEVHLKQQTWMADVDWDYFRKLQSQIKEIDDMPY